MSRRLEKIRHDSRRRHADQLVASHHGVLVALSMIIAVLASYVALDLGGRIRASSGIARGTWLVTAAIALGGGIWSMHFVAMLAFRLPVPATYDPTLTILSLLLTTPAWKRCGWMRR